VIASAYNFQQRHPASPAPVVAVAGQTLRRMRRLGLITKCPDHAKVPVAEADHILTEKGAAVAALINDRFKLALTVPVMN